MAGADRSGVKTNKRFCKQQIMNELNLDRLNLTSPYTLWRTENNSYGFRTNEYIDNYIGIIIQRNNPQLEKYLDDFENFVRFFTQKPI